VGLHLGLCLGLFHQYFPPIDRGDLFSSFVEMVLDQMDVIASDQKDHYEFCVARFQHLDHQVV